MTFPTRFELDQKVEFNKQQKILAFKWIINYKYCILNINETILNTVKGFVHDK